MVPTFSALVFLQTGGGLGAHLFLPYIPAHHGIGLILIMNNSPAEMLCVYSERTGIGEGDGEQVFCRLCLLVSMSEHVSIPFDIFSDKMYE
jgi:hypothetical protein